MQLLENCCTIAEIADQMGRATSSVHKKIVSLGASPVANSLQKRFERLVHPEPMSGCFLWLGTIMPDNRGLFWTGERVQTAPTTALSLAGRPLEKGQWALHHCDNANCVNPDHLYAGSHQDNVNDMQRRGRHGMAKLTKVEVVEIREAYRLGEKQDDVASRFGVGQQQISRIANRRRWAHVA